MKNVKKIICILLALALLFGVTACGKKEAETSEEDTEISAYSVGIGDDGLFTSFDPFEFTEVPECKGIALPADVYNVSDESLQSAIDAVLADNPIYKKDTTSVIKDGDTLNIDYIGTIDGVEFDGGNTKGNGAEVTIGVTNYIDDFLEQLIGHVPGDTVKVEVTFPDDYGNTALNGKDAVFATTINYIIIEGTPELNDEYVSTFLVEEYGCETVEEFKAYEEKTLRQSQIDDYLYDWIEENLPISSIPDVLIEYERNAIAKDVELTASMYGYEVKDYIAAYGYSDMEELLDGYSEKINSLAENTIRMQAIARTYEIAATQNEVVDYFTQSLGAYYLTYESLYGYPYMANLYLNVMILNFLTNNAVH